jgi:four helix bundle protein
MSFLFTKLDVYKKAIELAVKISCIIEKFPKGTTYLSDQLNRAVLSISLNIAEGNGRFSRKERQNYFRIARGSAFECVPILELCMRKRFIDEEEYQSLISELEKVCKMLSGLIKLFYQT